MRKLIALLISPLLALTSFRFSKLYRLEITKFHSFIYLIINTVSANNYANNIKTWHTNCK